MKNNNIGLFIMGIIMGGTIMFIILGFSQLPNVSFSENIIFTPTSDHLPHLLALEPTSIPQLATQTSTSVITSEPEPTSTKLAFHSTPTPLILVNKQQSETIGYSVEEKPLNVYTFGNGEQERMIVAGIHGGDEWNTVTLANQLIVHLNENPSVIPEDVTLYILPNLNPDGEARAHNKNGRLNNNGVDLNRNFPVNWLKDWDRAGCWNSLPSSGGTEPGSEAETQALMNFISSHNI